MWKVAGVLSLLAGVVFGISTACGVISGNVFLIVVMGFFTIVFLLLGIFMVRLKTRKPTPEEREAAKRRAYGYHTSGLPLASSCLCSVDFGDSEVVIAGGESVFRVPFEKCVDLRIEQESQIERYYGYSIPGALIGGAALGPAGAGLLGVRQKKRRAYTNYLVIVYNPENNRVSRLIFRLLDGTIIKTSGLVKKYLPYCKGQRADITL